MFRKLMGHKLSKVRHLRRRQTCFQTWAWARVHPMFQDLCYTGKNVGEALSRTGVSILSLFDLI